MRTVDDHRRAILAGIHPLAPIELPLSTAHGCVLAADVSAPWPLPSFDHAAADGYAVRAADVAAASVAAPVELTVIDEVPAGFRSVETVGEGTAVRIMAGAPIPAGADAVVPVDRTDGGAETARVSTPVTGGDGIRRAAEDVVAGEVVLRAGTLIGARQVAMLAAVGSGLVVVHPRPRVAVVSTGAELVEPGTPLRHGLVSDANSYVLVAACREAGADAYRVGPVPDDELALRDAVEDQLHRCDLIVTSGGASDGAHDTVRTVLSRLGTVEFTAVALDPGASQGYGTVGEDEVPLIALPGSPVSTYVSFETFVRPALQAMRGMADIDRPQLRVPCATAFTSPEGVRQLVRARFLPSGSVALVGHGQGAHMMGGLAAADALAVVDEATTEVAAGDVVTVLDLRSGSW